MGEIIYKDIENEFRESYLNYAMSVIVSRALPDVRDGLKPVHRRILYSMNEIGLQSNKTTKKAARIVGDVLGKYHPHGDASVYDALVRMAQDFSLRYLAVDGQGNFGSIDGDPPAAMRYTEAKMSKFADLMLKDIEKKTVDFGPNYDESLKEPLVLPSAVPFLLANGSSGIAVGMSTNIPPYNMKEIVSGICALIDNPDINIDEISRHITGPDFPTGGLIYGREGIRKALRTGRGSIVMRAKTSIEEINDGRDTREAIIVTEIPYVEKKSELIKRIAELVKDDRLQGISDVQDHSDKDGLRIVIKLKKNAVAKVVLNQLFLHTNLQKNFGVINLVLVNGMPKILNIKETMQEYVNFRKEVIRRRTEFELEKARERAHILQGLIIAQDNIEEVVKIIREAENKNTAQVTLMERFNLSDRQSNAILEMRLHQLTQLDVTKLRNEYEEVCQLIARLEEILSSDTNVLQVVREELIRDTKPFMDERRTEIIDAEGGAGIIEEDLIQEEDVVITMSHKGFIKRTPVSDFRTQGKGGVGVNGGKMRDDDFVKQMFVVNTHEFLLFFTDKGQVFLLKAYQIPQASRTAKGEIIRNFINTTPEDQITAILTLKDFNDTSKSIFIATKRGVVKKTSLSEFTRINQNGKRAITLAEDDCVIDVIITSGKDELVLATKKGKALRIDENDVRVMGRTAGGVRGIKLADDDELLGLCPIFENGLIMMLTENGYGKRLEFDNFSQHHRGTGGQLYYKDKNNKGEVAAVLSIIEGEDIFAITVKGQIIRISSDQISKQGRAASGIRLVRVSDDDKIIAASRAPASEEEKTEEGDTTPATEEPNAENITPETAETVEETQET